MEKWLQSNNIPNEKKLKQAVSALTEKANEWWLKESAPTSYKQPVLDWRDLKVRMHKEFVEKSQATPMKKTPPSTLQEEQNQNVKKPQEELNVSSSSALHKPPAAPHQGTDAILKELGKEEKVQASALFEPTNDPELGTLPTTANIVQPKIDQSTRGKEKCPKEKSAVQRTEKDQPLLIHKGMDESSNSARCANKIFRCHDQEKLIVLEESVEDNTMKKETPCEVQEENPPEGATILEQPINHEPEPIPKPLGDNLQKHCKEICLSSTLPNLFVLVTPEEEKRFGLEKVKEFHVSRNVFDKMISSFEIFKLEEFFKTKRFMCSEFDFSLRDSLSIKTSEFAFDRSFSEIKQLLGNAL